jgi:hypothetical protein
MSDGTASSEPGREGRDPSSELEMVAGVAFPTGVADDDFPKDCRWLPRTWAAFSLVTLRRGFDTDKLFSCLSCIVGVRCIVSGLHVVIILAVRGFINLKLGTCALYLK